MSSEPRKERGSSRLRRRGGQSRSKKDEPDATGAQRSASQPNGDAASSAAIKVEPRAALKELFPEWAQEDLYAVLQECSDNLEEAVARITSGVATQWGHVKTRKEKAEEAAQREQQERFKRKSTRAEVPRESRDTRETAKAKPARTKEAKGANPKESKARPRAVKESGESAANGIHIVETATVEVTPQMSWAQALAQPESPEAVVETNTETPAGPESSVSESHNSTHKGPKDGFEDGKTKEPKAAKERRRKHVAPAEEIAASSVEAPPATAPAPPVPSSGLSWAAALATPPQPKTVPKVADSGSNSLSNAAAHTAEATEGNGVETDGDKKRNRRSGRRRTNKGEGVGYSSNESSAAPEHQATANTSLAPEAPTESMQNLSVNLPKNVPTEPAAHRVETHQQQQQQQQQQPLQQHIHQPQIPPIPAVPQVPQPQFQSMPQFHQQHDQAQSQAYNGYDMSMQYNFPNTFPPQRFGYGAEYQDPAAMYNGFYYQQQAAAPTDSSGQQPQQLSANDAQQQGQQPQQQANYTYAGYGFPGYQGYYFPGYQGYPGYSMPPQFPQQTQQQTLAQQTGAQPGPPGQDGAPPMPYYGYYPPTRPEYYEQSGANPGQGQNQGQWEYTA